MTLGSRIKQAREAKGITQRELGDHFGVTEQAVSAWEADRNKPSAARLHTISRILSCSHDWLITGQGELHQPTVNPTVTAGLGGGSVVPQLDWTKAQAHVQFGSADAVGLVHTQYPCGPRSFSLRIADDANSPTYARGDAIIVDPDIKPEPGDMVLVAVSDEMPPILRRFRKREEAVELTPLNTDWAPTTVDRLNADNLLGVVTEHTKPARRPT